MRTHGCGQICAQSTAVLQPLLLVTEISPFDSFNFSAVGIVQLPDSSCSLSFLPLRPLY